MKFLLLFSVCLFKYVQPHSWIACSDYTEKNGRYWSASKCRGYPRDASRYAQKESFGQDRGFDHRPGNGGSACKTSYSGSSYSSAYPKAIYYPGQQVILAHPMKNHGADSCTNQHIPDSGNFIYRGRKGTDRDRQLSHYRSRLVANLGVSVFGNNAGSVIRRYPKPGYQNAPAFCEDTDKSMGTYSFNVPRDIEAGEYTFVWRWSFNGPGDLYSTCFDVIIAQNKAARDRMLRSRRMSLQVACGGRTSSLSPGSSVGCEGGSGAPAPPPPEPTTSRRRTTTRMPATTRRPVRPRPTNRPTNRPTTTSTPKPAVSREAEVNAYQISGEILLQRPRNGVTRRRVTIEFDCKSRVNFWNARVVEKDDDSYTLLQEDAEELRSQKIFFTASFDEPCSLLAYPPIASLERDE